jgi:hypothetical protein
MLASSFRKNSKSANHHDRKKNRQDPKEHGGDPLHFKMSVSNFTRALSGRFMYG